MSSKKIVAVIVTIVFAVLVTALIFLFGYDLFFNNLGIFSSLLSELSDGVKPLVPFVNELVS